MTLPIQRIPNTHPPRFRWMQTVGTPLGKRRVAYEGVLPPNIEEAVISLVAQAEQLEIERNKLQEENNRLLDQCELLSKMIEDESVSKPVNTSTGRRKG